MTFEGEVLQLDLMNKLVELWRDKFTGALRFESDAVIKIIYFKQGNIISASTNDRADSIDEVLSKAGKINKDHVRQALAKRKESETLGDALLGLGFITKKELAWARRVQLVGVIRSILGWTAGNFTIVADYLPKREEGTIFYVPQIVLELIVTDSDRDKFVKALDDGAAVFQKSDDFDSDYPFLGLNEDADRIVDVIDGTRSAADIAASSSMDSFNVFKLLHALHALGLIQPPKPQESPDVFPQSDNAFDFQLDDASATDADADWSLPPSEPESPLVAVTPEPPGEEFSIDVDEEPSDWPVGPAPEAPEAPVAAADDFAFETSSSAKAEEWLTTEEEEPAAEIPASIPPSRPATPPRSEEFSLSVDPDVIGGPGRAAHAEKYPETVSSTASSGHAPAENLSATWPRAKQRPSLTPVSAPKRRSRTPMLVATAVIVLVAALGAGWFLFMRPSGEPEPTVATAAQRPRPATSTPTVATTTESTTQGSVSTSTTPMVTPVSTAASQQPAPVKVTPSVAAKAPTPAPAASSNPTRAKYEQMAAEFARTANRAEFTVQFELVCQTDSVTRALRDGGSNVWFAPTSYKGGTCFRVFWGHYASKSAAEAAIGQIPASLRAGSKSTAVNVGEVLK